MLLGLTHLKKISRTFSIFYARCKAKEIVIEETFDESPVDPSIILPDLQPFRLLNYAIFANVRQPETSLRK